MPGNAAGLPVVILIEAANPAVAVHRNIKMDFVTAGAEFPGLFAHERLQEGAAMRLRIHLHHEVVQRAHHRIFAGGEFMQFRIFENEIALAHGAFHVDDAVAHHATEPGLCRRSIFNLANRRIEHSAEEQRRIVTASTPFGGFHPGDVLHVLNTFAIPLIVEGRKVMRRAVPLFVDVFVAPLASLRLHEIFRGNVFSVFGLRGTWEKFAGGTVAFTVHRF